MLVSTSHFFSPINPQSFCIEVKKQWAFIASEGLGNPGKNPKDGGERAYQVYIRTYQSCFPFIILGPDRIRNNEELVDNVGLVTSPSPSKKRNREDPASLSGSILGERQWSLLVNDAFILGGMHAGKDFHIAISKRHLTSMDALWDNTTHNMRPLGRELAILKLSGYECVDAHNLGIVFCCCIPEQIPKSLTELHNRVKEINSVEKFQSILTKLIDYKLRFQKPSSKDRGTDSGKAPLENA